MVVGLQNSAIIIIEHNQQANVAIHIHIIMMIILLLMVLLGVAEPDGLHLCRNYYTLGAAL